MESTRSRWRALLPVLAGMMVAAACSAAPDGDDGALADGARPTVDTVTSTSIEDYPDAQTRALRRLENAPRPVANSALPPRHLNPERFPETLVERHLIVSGGVAPDAIPPIDEPRFEPVADVDWLDDDEAVLALQVGAVARAYPIQVMIWHEIVNDTVDGTPITVTYCPLCNSGVAVDRRAPDGTVLDFGVSGALYQSALVMYDRQSESLWTHFDGVAVVGDRIGQRLDLVPVSTVAWSDFAAAHPDGEVLARMDPSRPYGRNPYGSYDTRTEPLGGFFEGDTDDRLPAMARVVGVRVDRSEVAVSLDRLRRERTVALDLDGVRVVAVWAPGAVSALDTNRVDDGADIGATGVFRTDRTLTADPDRDGVFVDSDGGSWDVLGNPVGGDGPALDPVVHLDTFWFAWSAYHPATALAA